MNDYQKQRFGVFCVILTHTYSLTHLRTLHTLKRLNNILLNNFYLFEEINYGKNSKNPSKAKIKWTLNY